MTELKRWCEDNNIKLTRTMYGLLAEMPDGKFCRRSSSTPLDINEFKNDLENYIKRIQ